MSKNQQRMETLDVLRGLASLAVCWFHFTQCGSGLLPDGWLRATGRPGWLGVEVFFVISGFVIPLSLHRSGYQWRNFGTFVLKRLVRLDPPYLAAIGIILFLGWLDGAQSHFSAGQVLTHLGYVNVLVGYKWLNPVFWTLAIEFQYYLFIGLLFPLVASPRWWVRAAALVSFGALGFACRADVYLFHYSFLFMLGMATFHFRSGLANRRLFLALVAMMGVGTWLTLGRGYAAVGVGTALIIGFAEIRGRRALRFLGDISYSLYLLHAPIGMRIIALSMEHATSMAEKVAVLGAALAASIGAATLLHRWVEKPAQKWSSGIRFQRESGHEPQLEMPARAA
jgi:peptidoglycan/LPS O-acetylase OafA/YrhL